MLAGCLLGFAGTYIISAVIELMWIAGLRDEDIPLLEESDADLSDQDLDLWPQVPTRILLVLPQLNCKEPVA